MPASLAQCGLQSVKPRYGASVSESTRLSTKSGRSDAEGYSFHRNADSAQPSHGFRIHKLSFETIAEAASNEPANSKHTRCLQWAFSPLTDS